MIKSLFVLLLILLVVFFIVGFSQSVQYFIEPEDSISKKISPLNFEIVEDIYLADNDEDKYTAHVTLPQNEIKPKPIPMPTPAPVIMAGMEEQNPYSIIVDTRKQVVTIMTRDEDGFFTIPYKQFRCSSGTNSTPTVLGEFKLRKKAPYLISHASISSTGEESRVYARYRITIHEDYHFHSILYAEMGDHDSLKTTSFYNIGGKASHGCVRMLVRDVKWIYTNCDIGTPISIRRSGGPALDQDILQPIPLNQKLPRGVTYDPTDLTHVNEIRRIN